MAEFMTETEQGSTGEAGPGGSGEEPAPPGAHQRRRPAVDAGAGPLDGQEALALLERTRALVDPELRAAIESLPGSMRRVALYHFGWQQADGTPAAGNAGKAIRPALVLAAATALGGPGARAAAVRAAAAVASRYPSAYYRYPSAYFSGTTVATIRSTRPSGTLTPSRTPSRTPGRVRCSRMRPSIAR